MKRVVKLGVRTLVEHLLRTGDLAYDFFSQNRAIDGIRAHQHIQAIRPSNYQAEVHLVHRHESDEYVLEIQGRIDGVLRENKQVVIEEIKSTHKDPVRLAENKHPLHWGQLKLYAFMYARTHGIEKIVGQLTYVNPENWQTHEIRENFSIKELESFFSEIIQRYLKWVDLLVKWKTIRTATIQALNFPYPHYRPGQHRMAAAVYRTLKKEEKILIQAPTGIGKTMGTIFPALKTIGEAPSAMLFYLTARTTGRMAAEKVFEFLNRHGLRFKTVTLTAKDKICFCPTRNCDPEACRFAKGYYDRVNDAIWDALNHDRFRREQIEALAQTHSLCPFEFSLDLSQWADGIICDYNYVFNPRVYLRRYFDEGDGRHLLLIDEAHNLVDRSREMFSAQIAKQPLLELRRAVKGKLQEVYKSLTQVNRWFITAARKAPEASCEAWSHDYFPSELIPLLTQFTRTAEKWLVLNIPSDFREALLEHYFAILSFMRVAEEFDDSYAVCYNKERTDTQIKLFCIDPSRQMAQALRRGAAIVFFSATLTPMHYFKSLFGCGPETKSIGLPSPFPEENFALYRADRISTLYRQRETSRLDLCQMLTAFTNYKKGNYLFFFPSYAYLNMILESFRSSDPEVEIIVQTPAMSEEDRIQFLSCFQEKKSRTLIGFAVMGGIFGEGIDLVGNRLLGAAIIGVGLPGISLERELIRAYFNGNRQLGFEYAYKYPGINRVLQAVGRVIRTEKDQGAVLLIDTRFSTYSYASLLPEYWRSVRIADEAKLRYLLEKFWSKDL